VIHEGAWQQKRYDFEKEITVEISLTRQKTINGDIIISSPRFPNSSIRVPIQIMMEDQIRLSEATAFFGFVSTGELTSKALKLSASKPFRITKVDFDSPELQAHFDNGFKADTEQNLQLTLLPKVPKRIYEGKVKITTDLPALEVIEVPYFALSS
jgi:hypothetical protein